jgi:glycine cleavage system H protein
MMKFTKTHEWIRKEDSGEFTIGITEHAQELLGDMVFVELPKIGDSLQLGQSLGVVESVKAASDVYAPLSGTVKAINPLLESQPQLLNQDPLGEGWMIKINAPQTQEFDQLLNEREYQQLIQGDE